MPHVSNLISTRGITIPLPETTEIAQTNDYARLLKIETNAFAKPYYYEEIGKIDTNLLSDNAFALRNVPMNAPEPPGPEMTTAGDASHQQNAMAETGQINSAWEAIYTENQALLEQIYKRRITQPPLSAVSNILLQNYSNVPYYRKELQKRALKYLHPFDLIKETETKETETKKKDHGDEMKGEVEKVVPTFGEESPPPPPPPPPSSTPPLSPSAPSPDIPFETPRPPLYPRPKNHPSSLSAKRKLHEIADTQRTLSFHDNNDDDDLLNFWKSQPDLKSITIKSTAPTYEQNNQYDDMLTYTIPSTKIAPSFRIFHTKKEAEEHAKKEKEKEMDEISELTEFTVDKKLIEEEEKKTATKKRLESKEKERRMKRKQFDYHKQERMEENQREQKLIDEFHSLQEFALSTLDEIKEEDIRTIDKLAKLFPIGKGNQKEKQIANRIKYLQMQANVNRKISSLLRPKDRFGGKGFAPIERTNMKRNEFRLGNYHIDKNQLIGGTVSLRYANNGGRIKGLSVHRVTPNIKNYLMRHIAGKPTSTDFPPKTFDENEKVYIKSLFRRAGLNRTLKPQEGTSLKQLHLLLADYNAGNDSHAMKIKIQNLISYLLQKGKLNRETKEEILSLL